MPLPALLLLIATILPLISFGVLLFVGKKMGTPIAGWFATILIACSFILTGVAMVSWIGAPDGSEWGCGIRPINLALPWIPIGDGLRQSHAGYLDLGIYVDSLTVVMCCMITLVATLVHVFSLAYMRDDDRFSRYYTYLGLFCFSMLGLVLGGTLLQMFIFWELVGFCSYLLIGFWYERKSASNAAIKAFVANRIGDFGFLIGLGILFYHVGNLTLPSLWVVLRGAGTGGAIHLPDGVTFGATLLTITGIGLFFGAVGKSAQFPLHVWLPDAMEGPTPVSALIHAATMVAAGVYLVARIFPILTPDARLFIAIIGLITLTMAALIAMAQSDIKRVLAYSTLSQLGYMMLAMGVGSWVGGLFHLITHAFFKSLLFLAAGSVIHAAGHEQELPQFGGLIKKIPVTGITFLIAVFAISGAGFGGWGLSGYYSKDMILTHAGAFATLATHAGKSNAYFAFFLLPTIVAYLTAFYMMRCWMLTFWGKPRNKHIFDHARETPTMWLPLAALAVLSIVSGSSRNLGVSFLLENSIKESTNYCRQMEADFNGFSAAWPAATPQEVSADQRDVTDAPAGPLTDSQRAHNHGREMVDIYVSYAFVVGIGIAFICYARGYGVSNVLLKIAPVRWVHTWLYRRMFFDELYHSVFIAVVFALSALASGVDRYIVDGMVNASATLVRGLAMVAQAVDRYGVDGAVSGVARLSQELGAAVRAPQTGRIRMYITALMLAITLGLAGAIIVVLVR